MSNDTTKSIFLVWGSAGYDPDFHWFVRAFATRDEASELAQRLDDWAKANGLDRDTLKAMGLSASVDRTFAASKSGIKPPEDLRFQIESEGVFYEVEEVPFGDAPDMRPLPVAAEREP